LHHGSVPAHAMLIIQDILVKKSITKLNIYHTHQIWSCETSGYSQKGHAFSDTLNIQAYAKRILKSIQKEGFQQCFEQQKHKVLSMLLCTVTTSKVPATTTV
jgi:hypothetical protein